MSAFGALVVIVLGLGTGLAAVVVMYTSLAKRRHDLRSGVEKLQAQVDDKIQLLERVKGLVALLVDIKEIKSRGRELKVLQESLKTERGRITITQAELETVEGRLRELEEIDRELEASGIETKEEINVLKKKEKELSTKNDALKEQIALSMQQIEAIMGELQLNAQLKEQAELMKAHLLDAQQKIDELLLAIEQGNEQYFILKKRYDALDIEYAQLFEKFSEAEALAGKVAAPAAG